ncbi:protein gp37 [Paraburkholderia sp. CI3]
MEPLLGPVSFDGMFASSNWRDHTNMLEPLDWVIVGGESGRGARPMHPAWARSLRDQCETAGVPYFFKQWGEWAPGNSCAGSDLIGGDRSRLASGFFDYNDGWNSLGPNAFRQTMDRIGKEAAGRELDGRIHNNFPETFLHTK